VALLSSAKALGLDEPDLMATDYDLEPIRSRDDFRALTQRDSLSAGLDRYGGVWASVPGRVSQVLFGLSPAEHLSRVRELAAQGYRPVAIALASAPNASGLTAASVWHRPTTVQPAR
jgi:hypothetical protein